MSRLTTISGALDDVLDDLDVLREEQSAAQAVSRAVEDNITRIRIWAGNIGAFHSQDDRRSVAFRLRTVPAVSKRILELLGDVGRDSRELLSIMRGERIDASERIAQEDLDEDDLALLAEMGEPQSEAQEIVSSMADSITSLFRISIFLRRATPRDRYTRAQMKLQSSLFGALAHYDRRHVAEKFPKVERDPALLDRLGNAITERRRFLQYAKEHHLRIANARPAEDRAQEHPFKASDDVDPRVEDAGTVSERPSQMATDASTLQPVTGITTLNEAIRKLDTIGDDDDAYSQGTSRTSFHDLTCKDGRLEVIPLQQNSNDGLPFECPYCWQIVVFKRQTAWKKHVMRDLRAYTCTFADCNAGLFEHREDWFKHELETHRRTWVCPSCNDTGKSYASASLLQEHQKEHDTSIRSFDVVKLLDACSRPILKMPADSACPLCDEYETPNGDLHASKPVITTLDIKRHLANHLEQLALFAILPTTDKDDGSDSGSNADQDSMSGHPDTLSDQDLLNVELKNDGPSPSAEVRPNLDRDSIRSLLKQLAEDDGATGPHVTHLDAFLNEQGKENHVQHQYNRYPQQNLRGDVQQVLQTPSEERITSKGSNDGSTGSPFNSSGMPAKREKWNPTDHVHGTLKDQNRSSAEIEARECFERGQWEEARKMYENLTMTTIALGGKTDACTLTNMFWLAETYMNLGKFQQAIYLHREVLQLRTESLGEQHPDTLKTLYALAEVHMASRQFSEAEGLLKSLVTSNESELGKEHYNTLLSRETLASCYHRSKRTETAIQQWEDLIPLMKRVLGPEHPATLSSLFNLSVDYSLTGRLQAALDLANEIWAIRQETLGSQHPETLSIALHLSTCFRLIGRLDEASELGRLLLETSKRVLGSDHPYTVSAMLNMSAIYQMTHRPKEAVALCEEVLKIRRKYLPFGHPYTLASMSELSDALRQAGRSDEGILMREAVLQLKKDNFGPFDSDTLDSMTALAWDYSEIGQRAKALSIMKEAVLLSTEHQGSRHPSTLDLIKWLDELSLKNHEVESNAEDTSLDRAQNSA